MNHCNYEWNVLTTTVTTNTVRYCSYFPKRDNRLILHELIYEIGKSSGKIRGTHKMSCSSLAAMT